MKAERAKEKAAIILKLLAEAKEQRKGKEGKNNGIIGKHWVNCRFQKRQNVNLSNNI